MKKLQNKKGITLIALIITIIVMLILVAVTVNVALNGGLFNTTELAKEETKMQAEKEMLWAETIAAYDAETGMIDEGKLRTNLEAPGWTVETENGQTVYISPSNKKYTVGQNFEVAYIGDVVEESVKHLEDDNNPLTIGSIEDLVDLSIAVNEGTTYEGETITLLTSLDFDNPESYRNSEDTSYGDINGNEIVEPIITELTEGLGFMPIGKITGTHAELGLPLANSFNGTFDGNGKTISNLYINRTNESAALFGDISSKATIKNLTIKNPEIYGMYSSGLAISLGVPEGLTEENIMSYTSGVLTIENCHTKGGEIGAVNENCISQYSSGVLIAPLTLGNIDIKESSNSSAIIGIASAGITYSMGLGQVEIKKCNNYGDIIIEDADTYKAAEKDASDSGIAGCAITATQSGVKIDECFNYGTLNATAGVKLSGLVIGSSVSTSNSSNYGTLNYSGGDYVYIAGVYLDPGYDMSGDIIGKTERCNNYGEINADCVNAVSCEIAGITAPYSNSCEVIVSECINKGNIKVSGKLSHSSSNEFIVAGIDLKSYIINNCINYGNISESVESQYSSKWTSGISSSGNNIINCANYGELSGRNVYCIARNLSNISISNCYNAYYTTVYIDGNTYYTLTGNETVKEKEDLLAELNEQVVTHNEKLEKDLLEEPQLAELIGKYLFKSEWKIDPNINNGYPVFNWQQAEQ